ncbi:transporter [Sphingobium sp. AP49]|uniref:SphA family protein n=1 Tax=Sphingobium sp. AP49 TaxID=1144307 RepID=UPI00026ED7A0|nr:transporter [Sphingobium sp. AP49]WHO39400.1 transporter [Sphingobium sp. AP49]
MLIFRLRVSAIQQLCAITALGSCLWTAPCHASEGGASFYLLGGSGPGAAVMPPVEGVFFDDTVYIYDGKAQADREFVIGGNVVAGAHATLVADFGTIMWVPTTNFLGGTLALSASLPVGAPMVGVTAVVSGPGGGSASISRHDSALLVGDPVGAVLLGWKAGKLHFQGSATVNVPVGNYRDGQLANVSFNRWIVDSSFAATWNDPKAGWDISAKAGFTFNGENPATDYKTGTEFHLEGAVEKTLSPAFSAGIQSYYFKQVSGDSGAGAALGPFKGEAAALGATAALNVKMGGVPATFRVRAFKEFDVTNRLKGEAYFLSLTLPLSLNIPESAAE